MDNVTEFDSRDLRKHMCALKAQGLEECIKVLSDRPVVKCRYCGSRANSLRNICVVNLEEDDDLAFSKT